MALYNSYSGQDSDEFPTHGGLVLVHTLDETLLCGIPCTVLFGHERRERRENHMAKDLGSAFRRFCLFLSQLVALSIAHRKNWSGFALYLYAVFGLYLSADGWRMDEPTAQKQSDGWCIQHGEREFHAGNTIDGEWILGKSSYTLLLQKEVEQRLDQCGQSLPCLNGARHTGVG